MNNTRFATAIHILTLLAHFPDEWISSDFIAGSINVNPVVVRKELQVLNEAGLIATKKGKEGGTQLRKSAATIYLSEVYLAVKNSEVLGRKNLLPNSNCPIGKQMNTQLSQLFNDTDAVVVGYLQGKTLQEFVHQFV